MPQVAHDEHGLRRVIDEDREVDGPGERDRLDLCRSMMLESAERVIDACRGLLEF
jgi:hypothetical protein